MQGWWEKVSTQPTCPYIRVAVLIELIIPNIQVYGGTWLKEEVGTNKKGIGGINTKGSLVQ